MKLTKKIVLGFALMLSAIWNLKAQETKVNFDSKMPRWYLGASVFGGLNTSNIDQTNWSKSYLNAINVNMPNLEQKSANNFGINLNLGYYFGKNRNFGLGTGLQYIQNRSNLGLNPFSLEYQSIDNFGNVFRQGVRSNSGLEEQVKQSVLGIPVMILVKKQLNERWGLNLDAGLVFNVYNQTSYTTEAANFDYEAIYAFDANNKPIYDNNPTPNPDNWLVTKTHYEKVNTNGNVNVYFEDLYAQGYNVGLGVKPSNTSGDVKNTVVSTSWFIRPSVSYRLKPNLALHANFCFQQLTTTYESKSDYRITDKRASYSSVSNGINSHAQGLIQFGLGIRYYFGKERVAKPEPAPKAEEPKKVDPYKEMVKVTVQLQDEQYGKPVPGNIIIKNEKTTVFNGTADQSGISNFYLEPGNYTVGVTAKGYIPAEESLMLNSNEKGKSKIISLKQPKIEKGLVFKLKAINFETGSDNMKASSYDILNKMADILKENPNMVVEVAGHTDNTGDDQKNMLLSENRAKTVMNYLLNKGANANQLKAVGYGETKPIADNNTEDGRLANRRVMFTVLEF
jgi:outer membrane protein OmpA-like peptidoglycan-associated protein